MYVLISCAEPTSHCSKSQIQYIKQAQHGTYYLSICNTTKKWHLLYAFLRASRNQQATIALLTNYFSIERFSIMNQNQSMYFEVERKRSKLACFSCLLTGFLLMNCLVALHHSDCSITAFISHYKYDSVPHYLYSYCK